MKLNTGVRSTSVSNINLNRTSNSIPDYTQTDYEGEIDYTQTTPPEEIDYEKTILPTNKSNSHETTTTTVKTNDTDSAKTTVTVSLDSDNYSRNETHTLTKSNWNLEDLREYYNNINPDNNTNDSSIKFGNTLTLDAAESVLASVLENLTEEQKEYYSAYKENDLFSNGYDNTDGSILGIDGSEEFDGIEDYGAAIAEKYQEIMPIISLEEDIENLKYEQKMSYYIELVDSEEFKEFYNQDATNQALELFIYQNCFNFDELLNSPDYMKGIIFMTKDNVQYQYDDFASLREKLSQLNQTNLQVYFYLLKNNSLESANEYLSSVNPNVNYEKKQSTNYIAKYSKEFEKFISTFHSVGLNIDKEYIDYFNSIFQEINTLSIYAEPVNLQYDFLNQIYNCKTFYTKSHANNSYQGSDDYVEDIIKGLYPEFYQNYSESKEMKLTLDYVIDNCKSAILEQYPYMILEQSEAYKSFYDNIEKNPESETAKLYNEFNNISSNSNEVDTINDYYIADFLKKFENSDKKNNLHLVEALTTNVFYFTEEEKKNLFYLIANQGQDSAYSYFLTIHDDINSREGLKEAMDWMEEYNSKKTWYEKDLLITGSGIGDGIVNYIESINMLFSKNEVPTILEYKEMYIFNELLKDSEFRSHLYEFSQQVGEIGTQITIDLLLFKLSTLAEVKPLVKNLFKGVVSGAANAGESKHTLEMADVNDVGVGIYTITTLATSTLFAEISKRTFQSLVTPNATEGIRSILNNEFIFKQLTAMTASYADSNFKTIVKSIITTHKIDLETIFTSFSDNASKALIDGFVYASLDYATKRGDINTKFPIEVNGLSYEIDVAQLVKNLSKRTSVLKPSSFGDIETDYSEFEALYEACPELIKANPEHIFDDYLEKMESVSDGDELYEEVESEVQDELDKDKDSY